MSSAHAKRKSGGKRHKQLWHQLVAGMSQSPTTYKWVFATTRSVPLALKDLLSAAGEVREGITAEEFQEFQEFQEFIDGPNGVGFGLGVWINICREINLYMARKPAYPSKL